MKHFLAFALILGACGSTSVPPPDLSTLPDMTKEREEEPDLSAAVPPPDLMPPLCLLPKPGIYNEGNYFTYRTTPTGMTTYTSNGITVVVQPDGLIVRQPIPVNTVNQWHCDSPMMENPTTCQVPCCAGDPATVPMVYFSQNGWSLFRLGTCQWKDSNFVTFYIDVQNVFGHIN